MSEFTTIWEQRWHPFRGEWVLFASHRGGRPWLGETAAPQQRPDISYDQECALCPGNRRIDAENPNYSGAWYFENDLPPFGASAPCPAPVEEALFQTKAITGTSEVVCYSPNHSATMATLSKEQIVDVIRLWKYRTEVLGKRNDVDHVLIFENKGAATGTSNLHPHCQIYAGNLVYQNMGRESEISMSLFNKTGKLLGIEVMEAERSGPRCIVENASFSACLPWFATYAYEVHIYPRFQAGSLLDLSPIHTTDLAAILRDICIRYDNLWKMPMPYLMTIHQCPMNGSEQSAFPFHIEFHPPLRKPDTLKYLAGPEIGGGSMTNESNPDEKAAELKNTPGDNLIF